MRSLLVCLILSIASLVSAQDSKLPKLSVDEIVSKHISSIGTQAAISAKKSRVYVGVGTLQLKRGGLGKVGGPAQLASEGNKFLLSMVLNAVNYPYERIGFDGKDLTVGRPDGQRTMITEFLKSHSWIIKDGFFGGALSSAWLQTVSSSKKGKFDAGTAEVGGRTYYSLELSNDGVRVKLLFDPGTFQHLLTEYKVTVPPRFGTATENARAKPTYYVMVERFSRFAKAGDLTLPLGFSIDYNANEDEVSAGGTWDVQIENVYFDELLEPAVFRVS